MTPGKTHPIPQIKVSPITAKLRRELSQDPEYRKCMRANEDCKGRITFEHALIFAGRQVQERFAILSLCEWHHLGAGLNKQANIAIALSRMSESEKSKYSRADWIQQSRQKI